MALLAQDLRQGLRLLRKSPGFTLSALAVLALGIGANSAIFSVVNAVLLRPLPYPHPERLVRVWHTPPAKAFPGLKWFSVSPANYFDWESQNHVFEKIAIQHFTSLNFGGAGRPEAIPAAQVSREFFDVVGVPPELGRTFTPQENEPGAGHVVVLSHALWKSRFGGDPGVVGQEIRVDDQPYRIVGVMGPRIQTPDYATAWVPLAWDAKERAVRSNHNCVVTARLKPGVDRAQAQAEMTVISERLARAYPEDDEGWGAVVVPLREDLIGDVRPVLLVLLGAVALVLLIACANITNLVLARTLDRGKEIAIRSALGASRGRLMRQLGTETLLLALAGGAVGLFLAGVAVPGITAFLGDQLPRSADVSLDGWVLGFTLAMSVVTGVLAGLVPAWRLTNAGVAESLKRGLGRTDAESGGGPARGALVAAEVALSLVLLIGAGILIRSLWLLGRVDPGFDPHGVSTVSVMLPKTKYAEPSRQVAFFRALLERVRALPGVEAAGGASSVPLSDTNNWPVAIEGQPAAPVGQQPNVVGTIIAGDYLRALRIPLRRGRAFTPADGPDASRVVLVSESMARRFWPGQDPIGKRLTTAAYPEKPLEVVGIVGDVKYNGLDSPDPAPAMYVSFVQIPTFGMDVAIRSRGAGVAAAAVAAVQGLDPEQPVIQVSTMEQLLSSSIAPRRATMLLLAVFAGVALLLAAVGVYGVVAYAVRRRGREIGIRMALGAQVGDVLRMVMLQGMRPTLAGMTIGLVAALALGRVLSGFVYGVTTSDPPTIAVVALLLGIVALAACLVPARRATRVDPLRVLREE